MSKLTPEQFRMWMENVGSEINEFDELLIYILAWRTMTCVKVGAVKTEQGEPIYRPRVEEARLKSGKRIAEKLGQDPDFIGTIIHCIMSESFKQQAIHLQDGGAFTMSSDALRRLLVPKLEYLAERLRISE